MTNVREDTLQLMIVHKNNACLVNFCEDTLQLMIIHKNKACLVNFLHRQANLRMLPMCRNGKKSKEENVMLTERSTHGLNPSYMFKYCMHVKYNAVAKYSLSLSTCGHYL